MYWYDNNHRRHYERDSGDALAAGVTYAGSTFSDTVIAWLGLAHVPGIGIVVRVTSIVLVLVAWVAVTAWYVVFGILLWPYRLLRRGSRKRKRDELRHREALAAAGRGR